MFPGPWTAPWLSEVSLREGRGPGRAGSCPAFQQQESSNPNPAGPSRPRDLFSLPLRHDDRPDDNGDQRLPVLPRAPLEATKASWEGQAAAG